MEMEEALRMPSLGFPRVLLSPPSMIDLVSLPHLLKHVRSYPEQGHKEYHQNRTSLRTLAHPWWVLNTSILHSWDFRAEKEFAHLISIFNCGSREEWHVSCGHRKPGAWAPWGL